MSRILNTYTEYVEPSNLFTEEEQEQECCEVLSPPPDSCVDVGRTSDWNGVDQTSEDSDNGSLQFDPEAITAQHSGTPGFRSVVLVPVGGKDGKCGQKHEEWTDTLGCCVEAPQPYWTQTYANVAWNQTYVFKVEGGTPPYQWNTEGNGLSVIGAGEFGVVTVTDCFCAPGTVTVTDACGKVLTHGVTSEEGEWIDRGTTNCNLGGASDNHLPPANAAVFLQKISGLVKSVQRWAKSPFSAGGSIAPHSTPQEYVDWYWETFFSSYSSEPCLIPPDEDWELKHPSLYFYYANINYTYQGFGDNWTMQVDVWYVTPGGGDITTYDWVCDDTDELVYDDDASQDIVNDNSMAVVYVDGGRPPFTISVSGQGFWTNTNKDRTQKLQEGRQFYLYTSDACGACVVTITDYCGNEVTGSILSTSGSWQNHCQYSACLHENECGLIYDGCPTGISFDITVGDVRVTQTLSYFWSYPGAKATLGESQAQCATMRAAHQADLIEYMETYGDGFGKYCTTCPTADEVDNCPYNGVNPAPYFNCDDKSTCWGGTYSGIVLISGWYYQKTQHAISSYYQEWRFMC